MGRARRGDNPELGKQVSEAHMRHYKGAPRKVRAVADLIRGLSVIDAQHLLKALHRPSGCPVLKQVLDSAYANANNNVRKDEDETEKRKYKADELVLGEVVVHGGPIMYRFQPRAMGRAGRIRKRSCHISIKLYEEA